jgi:hypothetical protein
VRAVYPGQTSYLFTGSGVRGRQAVRAGFPRGQAGQHRVSHGWAVRSNAYGRS